jgi:hypothetical protein
MSKELKKILEDRQETYGDAQNNFAAIGQMWGAILEVDPIPPYIVALMFDSAKTIRAARNPHHKDSWLDKIGYTEHALKIVFPNES